MEALISKAGAPRGRVVFWVSDHETGQGDFAAGIGLCDTLIKLFIYFGHERLWNRIPYGRNDEQPEYFI